MKSKNIILSFLFLISLYQVISLEDINSSNEYINSYEELEDLINTPQFADYMAEKERDEVELQGLFSGDQCLMNYFDAVSTLHKTYGISNLFPDSNLRFILGTCNPVLLVPGIYATKLVVELECKNIATEEKDTTLKNLRVYCSDTICKDETKEKEEHPLFLAALDSSFTILGTGKDKYSSCLAFFMSYFQNPEECPAVNNKNLCFHSKYIKVGYYGSSTDTLDESRCGVEGVQNVIQTGKLFVDNIINFGASRSFYGIAKALIDRGYKEGFSLGALPNDFRRYLATNNFATKVFESQIERLYKNTGKPVVIVAHSFGTLLTLTNLLKKKGDATFLKKIKKFIAIAPPFAGATKLLDAFLHGLNDWNKEIDIMGKKVKITNYNIFGQYFMYKALPTIMELRPQSITTKIFNDDKYKELGEAIRARLETEKECKSTDCPASTIKEKTAKFDNIFKGYFPSLTDEECAYESSIGGNTKTYNRKCYTNMYNVADCPTIVTKSEKPTQEGLDKDAYCGKTGPNYYYQGDCTSGKHCLDEIYYANNKCPYLFRNTEAVNFIINRFNDGFSSKFGRIDSSYFDTYDQVKKGVQAVMKRQDDTSLIKDLPLPPVDTDVVYSSYAQTINMVVVDNEDFSAAGSLLYRGGDNTVPAWSSLLTGLKWIYDMKKDTSYKNKVRLIEYCSRIAYDGQYKYDPSKEQTFAALQCSCIKNNVYESGINACTHAAMINDGPMIDYVMSIVDCSKEANTVTETKINAINSYLENEDYEAVCNKDIKNIFDTAK